MHVEYYLCLRCALCILFLSVLFNARHAMPRRAMPRHDARPYSSVGSRKCFTDFCSSCLNISDSGRRNRRTSCLYVPWVPCLFLTAQHHTSLHLTCSTSIHDSTIRITPLPSVPTLCPATDTDSYSDPRASASSSIAATCTLLDVLLPTGGPYL